MTRSERLTILLVGVLIGAFAAIVATGLADQLGTHSWFGNGSNLIQWISGPGTFIAVVAGIAAYLNRTCAASPFCLRHGEHPVAGTLKKVCTHHHTLEHHEAIHRRHARAHTASGRLNRGESHGRAAESSS